MKELLWIFVQDNMSRDVLTVGSTMRISLLYRGEYSKWVERFMNYLEEQTDGEEMINSIKNGDQPLPRVTQVSIAGTSSTEQPPLKDKSMWSDQEKRILKIDRLARSLLIQGLPNDIYSLIDSNKTAKDLWDALARHMLGSEYSEQDRKAAVLYEYETFKANEGELLLDTYIRYLQVINDLKKCGYSKDNCIKEHVEKGTIELYFVKMDYQLADLFTKALPVDRFNYLVRRLGMRSLSPQELDRLAKSQ
nr:integrase, catalytic region, zinc finger, CCHC-type, peptidase aspartic, catalytic [Tanacetum cinerariifolium]